MAGDDGGHDRDLGSGKCAHERFKGTRGRDGSIPKTVSLHNP